MLRFCSFAVVASAFALAPSASRAQTVSVPAEGSLRVSACVTDSTLRFFPQVSESFRPVLRRPENPKVTPAVRQGPVNPLLATSTVSDTKTNVQGKFPGISFTAYEPPDPNIAVGFASIVEVVNSDIAFFDRSGNKQFQQPLDTFFSGVAQTNFVFDPKCVYDQGANRFVVVALEWNDAPQSSGVLLAISDDSNPNGVWRKYRFDTKVTKNSVTYWFDYPGLGYNKDAYLVTGNMFSFSNSFGFARSIAIRKSSILNGGTAASFFWDHPNFFTILPARTLESVSDKVFGACINDTSTMAVFAWKGLAAGTPTFSQTLVTIPTFTYFNSSATSTGGTTIDPVSDRLMDAAYRSGYLVCTHTARYSNSDNRSMVRWYEFQVGSWPTSGQVTRRQSGNVALSAPNFLFMPAISRNGAGGISILLTRSSNLRSADVYAVSHRSTDPLGTMGPLSFIASSGHSPLQSPNRWGVFQGLAIDPTDAKRFWACGEVLNASGQWTTVIASWIVP